MSCPLNIDFMDRNGTLEVFLQHRGQSLHQPLIKGLGHFHFGRLATLCAMLAFLKSLW